MHPRPLVASFPLLLLLGAGSVSAETPLPTPSSGPEAFVLFRTFIEEGRLVEARAELERALTVSSGDPYLHAEAARFFLRMGQLGLAAEQADEALRLAPESPDLLRVAGQVYMTMVERDPGALAKARNAFEGIRAARPGDLEALVSLGQIFMATGEPVRAAEVLREAVSFYPQHPMVLAMLADASRSAKDLVGAEPALRSLLSLVPDRLEARLELADLLLERGDARAAATLLSAAPADQATSPEVTRRLALSRYQGGDLAGAMAALDSLLADRPDFGGGHYLRGMVLLADGRPLEAVAEFESLRKKDPGNVELAGATARALDRAGESEKAAVLLAELEGRFAGEGRTAEAIEARLERADLLSRSGRLEEALALVDGEAAGSPDSSVRQSALQTRIEVLARLERWDEALGAVQLVLAEPEASGLRAELLFQARREAEALDLVRRLEASGDPRSLAAAAEALQRAGRHAEAVPLLERALAAEPKSPRLAFQLGVSLERSGRIPAAVEALSRSIELAPQFAAALNYLAYLWADAGEKLEEAAALAERAVGLSPENGAYVDTLGWVRYRQGNAEGARLLLERALRLEGEDAALFEHLGDVQAALGDREAALRSYQKSLVLGPENRASVERKRDGLLAKTGS